VSTVSNPFAQVARVVLAVLLLAVLLFIGAWAVILATTGLASLPPTLGAALVAALVTGVSIYGKQLFDRRNQVHLALRQERAAAYEEFLAMWFQVLSPVTGVPPPDTATIQASFASFTRKAMPLASDHFIKEWSTFRRQFPVGAAPPTGPTALLQFEKVLAAIRVDFGYSNKGLKTGDLLGLIVNDIDTVLVTLPPAVRNHRL
jgi:hypothetical protein